MDKVAQSNDMMLLFDSYSSDSKKLHESFKKAGYHCPVVVIEDDGFLPDDVISVYGYFLKDKGQEPPQGKPRYFNQITVPDYWEISGNNSSGKIHDLNKERGRIFYTEPKNKRLVRIVDWLDEKGVVRSCDFYNKYGNLYARVAFNAKGQKVNKSYFSPAGKEIIVENYVTGDIILNDQGEVKIFQSKVDFILHFIRVGQFKQSRLFFNSLSTPFFVSERLRPTAEKRDVLFWQEKERPDIPGNMQIILNGQAGRTAKIMVQNKNAYNKLLALGANPEVLHELGFIYAFERGNQHKPEVLICTNSDNIEHCHKLIEALPQMQFHIAAITEMSSKLMAAGTYSNVKLYPGVKTKVLEELFDQCDFYLDVNHGDEIVSAVYTAFLHNHLIYGFQETLHQKDYIAAENVYPSGKVDQMIADIKNVLQDPQLLKQRLEAQKIAAWTESVESYRKF